MKQVVKKKITSLLFLVVIIACSGENNPVNFSNYFSENNYLHGKVMTDFGSNAILKSDGTLWTWGSNWNGTLGHGTKNNINIPTQIKSISNIIDFDISDGMISALDIDGNIWFLGSNMISSHVWPEILNPKKISFLINTKKVYNNGYLLREDGSVWKIEIDSKASSSF